MFFRLIGPAVAAGGLLLGPGIAQAQAPAATGQPQLTEELKNLRREVFEELAERQVEKVQMLERELEQARRESRLVDAAFAREDREMAEWTNELETLEISPEQKAQAAMARREANAERAEQLREKRTAAVVREAEVVEKLAREQNRLQRARQVLQAVGR